MRLNHLCEKLRVKLVRRKGLGLNVDSLIAAIKDERGNRKPISTSMSLKPGLGVSKLKAGIMRQKIFRKAKVVKKSNRSIPRANLNVGSASKVLEENRIIDQVLPNVVVSGNDLSKSNP
ncbi:unnamed protein product [Lathyrus sativus]|nr:unnamed protein product [Lathyrus sativus]